MTGDTERFWYPFTATTVIARRLAPLLLVTLGAGLIIWAGREFYFWRRPWAVLPELFLGLLTWVSALYFWTLLPEVHAGEGGLAVRRLGPIWQRWTWDQVAGLHKAASIDLLGWSESFYTVSVWRPLASRRGRTRRAWHRRPVRAFRFSGHIRNCERLVTLIGERLQEV